MQYHLVEVSVTHIFKLFSAHACFGFPDWGNNNIGCYWIMYLGTGYEKWRYYYVYCDWSSHVNGPEWPGSVRWYSKPFFYLIVNLTPSFHFFLSIPLFLIVPLSRFVFLMLSSLFFSLKDRTECIECISCFTVSSGIEVLPLNLLQGLSLQGSFS